jgi:3D (Asp-Asp-Asp) domain-containing protein
LKISRFVAAVVTAAFLAAPRVSAQETPSTTTQADAAAVQAPQDAAPATDGATDSPAIPAKVIQATVTGYANGADGGAVGSMTASGGRTHWGTVAADWRLYPLGTRLQIEGFPNVIFTVEDSGGGVRGNIFDIWFPDLSTAVGFGTKSLKVTVLQ